MVELVFVIVVVGILSAMLIPKMQGDRLQEAADQVISHIRYTQHLAMVDDRFDPTGRNSEWYKERWQIYFMHHASVKDDKTLYWSYAIFTDTSNLHAGSPEFHEIAVNPSDPSKRLIGGSSSVVTKIWYDNSTTTKEMNLGKKYDITDVVFDDSCSNGAGAHKSSRIAFDYLGRPMKGDISGLVGAYDTTHMITKPCLITLFAGRADNNITISIEPETGFAQIVP
jgi:type II secretory pathway pseudopilin PulG